MRLRSHPNRPPMRTVLFCVDWKTENSTSVHSMRMESPLNQRLRWSPPDVVYTPIDVTSSRRYEQVSLDRLLNRINTSVASANRHAFLIFDQGREEMISRLYQRLKVRNHVPSRYEAWEDGEKTRNIPIEQVIGGPAFRSSDSDYLLQMVDFIAHALLKQEEEPIPRVEEHGIDEAFRILDAALNRQASGRDPQGVVRR